ncbi:MAG: Rrf2 family transcriptional regulator [Chloroflexota bacterium]|nr:Rrf2 family transcriptional regulator [Chloroflexota bacterium]
MKLSTRGRYGTRALLDIALHQSERPVLLKEVARRQEISPLYLERLITPLITAGILRSTRGARGGVSLSRPAGEVRLSEILRLLEGSIEPVECVNNPGVCSRSGACVTRDVWGELQKAMDDVLNGITLGDLVERQRVKDQTRHIMYDI